MIEKIIRKYVRQMIEKNEKTIKATVTDKKLEEFLGKPKYEITNILANDIPGIVNGLAYTSFGGDILPIEVVTYTSKEKTITTGNLGDVMKESVSIALGHIKSHAKEYDISMNKFEDLCIHINAIEASVPKDGPSAGVCLTTAIISSLTKRSVPSIYAMTGEMTLTGKVLPIGGLKEKAIGAYKSGIKKVFIPKKNANDLDDVPKEVQKEIEFVLVDNYSEIYNEIFIKDKKK